MWRHSELSFGLRAKKNQGIRSEYKPSKVACQFLDPIRHILNHHAVNYLVSLLCGLKLQLRDIVMARLITTLGPKRSDELGTILPHEHIFVDLRTWDAPGYAQAETEEVIQLMAPEITKAQNAGVSAIVECSTIGV
jgi:hypothetical protein